jgi:hypothetical protein
MERTNGKQYLETPDTASSVYGIYHNRSNLEDAVQTVKTAGFRTTDISVLMPNEEGPSDFAHEKSTKAPEGTATGAGSGAVIGGALGWLAGIGAIAVPGVGPFIAAGPIMGLLAGIGLGGAVGGVAGALIGLGIPEYEAKSYESKIHEGGMLLSIRCEGKEWRKKAEDILEDTGASNISSSGVSKGDSTEPVAGNY